MEGVTHDYKRHGTTTLFAALNTATGAVMTQCKPRHRHQEFLQFLRHIEDNVPRDLDVHLIVDNYGTHKHANVKKWLTRRPRFHVHYTPSRLSSMAREVGNTLSSSPEMATTGSSRHPHSLGTPSCEWSAQRAQIPLRVHPASDPLLRAQPSARGSQADTVYEFGAWDILLFTRNEVSTKRGQVQ